MRTSTRVALAYAMGAVALALVGFLSSFTCQYFVACVVAVAGFDSWRRWREVEDMSDYVDTLKSPTSQQQTGYGHKEDRI